MPNDFKLDEKVKSKRIIMFDNVMTIPEGATGQIVHPPNGSKIRAGYVWVVWDSDARHVHTSCECLKHA
jgi:hypothetical protein